MRVVLIISDSHVFIKNNINNIIDDDCDVNKCDYNNVSLEELLYDFSSISLFSNKKIVVVENSEEIFSKGFESEDLLSYLNNPSELTTVIFVTSKADKSNIFYKYILKNYVVFDSNEKKYSNNILAVKTYVKDHKSNITDNALEYIKDATLNNYDLMISEIDKLLILGKNNITDELVYNLVPLTPDGNTNKLIDALLLSDEKEAMNCVKNMEVLNVDLTKMVALLAWNVRVTYLIKIFRKDKAMLDNVLSIFKIPDFKYNKYVRMGNMRSEENFQDIIIELSQLDEQIKKYVTTKDTIGFYLIKMFCL